MRMLSAAAGVALLVAPFPALAQSDPALAPVQALDAGLLGIMKAGAKAGVKARAAAIGPVVDRSFDLPLMTRLAVGTSWTTIAPADQQALVAAFRRMTVNAYAVNFDGYGGQSFTVTPQVETRGDDKLVRTTLNDPKGTPVAISYRLRQSAGGWRVIDVLYRSVSQLATRRSDFGSVLQRGGAKALLARMDQIAAKGAG